MFLLFPFLSLPLFLISLCLELSFHEGKGVGRCSMRSGCMEEKHIGFID